MYIHKPETPRRCKHGEKNGHFPPSLPFLPYLILEFYHFLHGLVLLSCHRTRSGKWTGGQSMDMRCPLTGRGRKRQLDSGRRGSCWASDAASSAAGCPLISIWAAASTTPSRPLGWGFPVLRLQGCSHDSDLSNQMTALP